MARIPFTDVPYGEHGADRARLREINERLRRIANVVNANEGLRWEDLKFPAAIVNVPGPGTPPSENTTNGTLNFSVGEYVFFQVQMPHAWSEGSTIRPHVHWTKTTSQAGDVHWQLEYKHYAIGAVGDAAFTAVSGETPIAATPDNDTAEEHLLTSMPDSGDGIDMAGLTLSHMLLCKLSRIAATGTEYPADAQMIEVDIHYQVDSRGSVEIGSKA